MSPVSAGPLRVGQGWDVHRLVPGRALVLGGVEIPFEFGEDGHSDGDVLAHAATDAILGAAALGDIGSHFPPSDARWKDADSLDFLSAAALMARRAGWEISNLDCTVVLEKPKLAPYRDAIRASLSACLGLDPGAVSLKAKTNEGMGEIGRSQAVEAMAACLLFRA